MKMKLINYKGKEETVKLYSPFLSAFRITSKFGIRAGKEHRGFDIVPINVEDTLIHSVGWAVLERIDYQRLGAGNYFVWKSLWYPKNEVIYKYFHLKQLPVIENDYIANGKECINGIMGNTGHSKGAHLHFEIWIDGKPINPEKVEWIVTK